MTAPFECEVRFLIPDIAAFRARLAALGARREERYAFTDRYFRPAAGPWDARTRALRIREWREPPHPAELLLTQIAVERRRGLACKRSLLPQGKLRLYQGTADECAGVCEALGFVSWLAVVKSDCAIWDVPVLGKAIYEHVEGLGWTSEVEVDGGDPDEALRRIGAALDTLGIPRDRATDASLAVLVAERLGVPLPS